MRDSAENKPDLVQFSFDYIMYNLHKIVLLYINEIPKSNTN